MPNQRVSPFSRAGRELRAEIFTALMNGCAAANGFSFPILAVHCLRKGPLAAILYQEAGREGEVIVDFQERMNADYPVRTIYVELSNFRSVQSLLTEQLWQRARRESAANPRKNAHWRKCFPIESD
jgi:hypothetical protein